MDDRYLTPHRIDKRVFNSDKKLSKEYSKFNKKFEGLEKKLSEGHFNSGREKGFQRWGDSKHICYIGSKGDGGRIYYKFDLTTI